MSMNILGWSPKEWDASIGHAKGGDYRIKAEFTGKGRCPECGTAHVESRGKRRLKKVWDTRMHGHRVQVEVTIKQYKCLRKECPKNTFVYRPPEIDQDRSMTRRLLQTLRRESFRRRFADLEREYGVSAATIKHIFDEELERRLGSWQVVPPRIMGVDEVRIGTRRFVATNLDGENAALAEILEDRKRGTVEEFFRAPGLRESVEVVAMDMWAPYRKAVQRLLRPEVTIVVDKFHVLQAVNRVVDRERDGIVRYGMPAERRALKGSRSILRKRQGGLEQKELQQLERWRGGFPTLMEVYDLKESFYDIYLASDREEAEERLERWLCQVPGELEPVFSDVIRAVGNWRAEILNYFDGRVTNAGTEAINGLIREAWQLTRGCEFETLRAKMLFGGKQVKKFWKEEAAERKIPGSMAYGIGGKVRESQVLGADLKALVADMSERSGEWKDPELWSER